MPRHPRALPGTADSPAAPAIDFPSGISARGELENSVLMKPDAILGPRSGSDAFDPRKSLINPLIPDKLQLPKSDGKVSLNSW